MKHLKILKLRGGRESAHMQSSILLSLHHACTSPSLTSPPPPSPPHHSQPPRTTLASRLPHQPLSLAAVRPKLLSSASYRRGFLRNAAGNLCFLAQRRNSGSSRPRTPADPGSSPSSLRFCSPAFFRPPDRPPFLNPYRPLVVSSRRVTSWKKSVSLEHEWLTGEPRSQSPPPRDSRCPLIGCRPYKDSELSHFLQGCIYNTREDCWGAMALSGAPPYPYLRDSPSSH
ncbi:hypothetical protein E2C01_016647 [Portunus trituberculatus]|uniref:Uncharacterized protein n=1 Tax=Portunus trituberculatus TaxID=210409 RepID=A0A5B7DQ06_PORTR|nr:hypothetical protein [Portunus trituberculatus]